MKRTYLDYNSTTPLDSAVMDFMSAALGSVYGNPSSIHVEGRKARTIIDESREAVASLLTCQASEIIFCGSGSECNNLALKGISEAFKNKGNHLITSKVEHPSVINTFKYLEGKGWKVTYLDVDRWGNLNLNDLKAAIQSDTVLVSLMMANNETGVLFPIQEAASVAREKGVLFHTDAVQAVGKIDVNIRELNVDLLSLAAHKFYGPKGVGALYIRKGTHLEPVTHGGGQEDGRRGGTENIGGIMGLARAAEIVKDLLPQEMERLKGLKLYLKEGLEKTIKNVVFNVDHDCNLPNTLSVGFKGISGESLVMALDLEGFAVSSGSACSSGALNPSHVLTAMKLDDETIDGTLRLSLGRWSRSSEIDDFLKVLPPIIERVDTTL
ncbi:MAG: cysteine desulfurase [Proteobacteria bacterium]|nr:cysteine desulfurase [Pseudomonadota bacterium]